ncbi:hypothetical protein N7490_008338 [Penicillium lividum]|nr:hypothetical protein N7490_008338 [Penicillium lividum]
MTSRGACRFCQKGIASYCEMGGWVLGNHAAGTQAEYVRVPHATLSLHSLPTIISSHDALAVSDAFPTGLGCGVLNANEQPDGSAVIVGGGPVGIASLLTARVYTPSLIVMVDLDHAHLATAQELGAPASVDSSAPSAQQELMQLTDGHGIYSVIEIVGIPATFALCKEIVGAGGRIANVGVHVTKVDLHLERLWDRYIGKFRRGSDNLDLNTNLLTSLVSTCHWYMPRRHVVFYVLWNPERWMPVRVLLIVCF